MENKRVKYIDKAAVAAEINGVLNSYDPNEITSGKHYAQIKPDDALVVADAAYYKSATFADKVI